MLQFFAALLVFVVVIVGLAALLMLAMRYLADYGDCDIWINDQETPLSVDGGGTLLQALFNEEIFIPSACGGQATCSMCKVRVLEGGGPVLPTEEPHLTKVEKKLDTRLACQVKVKEDMRLVMPAVYFSIKRWHCTVRSSRNVATFIRELVLELPEEERLDFQAGGYIQIEIPPYEVDFRDFAIEEEYRAAWDQFDVWQYQSVNKEEVIRAYSMANHPAEGNIVILNIRIATPPPKSDHPPGISSSYIFGLKPGDRVWISGPYGEFLAQDTDREMLYLGGGAGMAPMRSHIFDQLDTKHTDRTISFWYGARSVCEMFYDEDFKRLEAAHPNFSYNVALSDKQPEDNWDGYEGFIHQVCLNTYLSTHPDPTQIEYYLCGPPPMIDAVVDMLHELGVPDDMIRYDKF